MKKLFVGLYPNKWNKSINLNIKKILTMEELNYLIVAPEMVWQWYYDENGAKHFKELLGREAQFFVKILNTKKDIYIEDILPVTVKKEST